MRNKQIAWVLVAVGALGLGSCRNVYPHSFSWPNRGVIIQSHAKPKEGAYLWNWDPYAVELLVEPMEDVNPVQTQHVLIATVRDAHGKPLPNRRVEWIISEGSIGDIVEVDESGWRAGRGYKVGNDYAISYTNNFDHVLSRGTEDPSDDIHLTTGQTWCVITSPIEGTTHITVYAPAIHNWEEHKVFAVKHWFDVEVQFPAAAVNPTATPHELTTRVARFSNDQPLEGYEVSYAVVGGPDGAFREGEGSSATVMTNSEGLATVTLDQLAPAEGVNDIVIEVVRPTHDKSQRAIDIASGTTTKTWIGPRVAISKAAPATSAINEAFTYSINVSNTSQVDATNVRVTDTLPEGIEYVSSAPDASVSGRTLSWDLGTLVAGGHQEFAVTVAARQAGNSTNCAEVTADQDLSDRDCAETATVAPLLVVEKVCTEEVLLCDPIECVITVSNTGNGSATGVMIRDELPDGLKTVDGEGVLEYDAETLAPGQVKQAKFSLKASKTGAFVNTAAATADGGLTASATSTTLVRQPVLKVTIVAPEMRYMGRPIHYEITVTNIGDAAAQGAVLVNTLPTTGATLLAVGGDGVVTDGQVTWSLGTMEPQASRTVTVEMKAMDRGVAHSSATVAARCADGSADADTRIEGMAALLLELIDIDDPIEIGATETYQITVTNQGFVEATNLVIECIMDPSQEFVSATGPAEATQTGQTIRFAPVARLDAKQTVTYRVVVRATAGGDLRFTVGMTSDQTKIPVTETESTHAY